MPTISMTKTSSNGEEIGAPVTGGGHGYNDRVGFRVRYDSIAAFRTDLEIYCFENKKHIIEDSKGRGPRSHRYTCQHCDNWRLCLTLVAKKHLDASEAPAGRVTDAEAVAKSDINKEWRILDKSNLVHGKQVVSDGGNILLEPCLGGTYKASAVSIFIHSV